MSLLTFSCRYKAFKNRKSIRWNFKSPLTAVNLKLLFPEYYHWMFVEYCYLYTTGWWRRKRKKKNAGKEDLGVNIHLKDCSFFSWYLRPSDDLNITVFLSCHYTGELGNTGGKVLQGCSRTSYQLCYLLSPHPPSDWISSRNWSRKQNGSIF